MGNKYLDTTLCDKAMIFAIKAHSNTERRGKGFPYIIHSMEAVEIVATLTSDQELLAAAVLHDTVEDTDITIEEIRTEFGERVAHLVLNESEERPAIKETDAEEKLSWHSRKEKAIMRIANSNYDSKIVAMGDKLSNIRAIARDYKQLGDKLWERFHAPNGRSDHEWHYRSLANALIDLADTEAYTEFIEKIEYVFGQPTFETIDMNDYTQSGEGFTAISYNHRDANRIVKLYSNCVPTKVSQQELTVARSISDLGINIPKTLRLVTDGTRYGVEFERIKNKKSFARAIADSPNDIEKYAKQFATECKKIHSTKCKIQHFESAHNYFFNIVKNNMLLNEKEKQQVCDFINATPKTITCLHGDMHIGNIITNGEQNWWIDFADFRYGNPLFDLGMFNFVCNYNDDDLIKKVYHISKQTMQKVWKIFVAEYFGTTDNEKIETLLAPYSVLYMLKYSNIGITPPSTYDYVKKYILK